MSLKVALTHLALIAAASAGTYFLVMSDVGEHLARSAAVSARVESSLRENSAEILHLREELKTLRTLVATPVRPPSATSTSSSASPSTATLREPSTADSPDAPAASNPEPTPADSRTEPPAIAALELEEQKVQKMVETVLTQREEAERAEAQARREKRREENLNQMMLALDEKLGLSSTQATEVRQILDNSRKLSEALRDEMRSQWDGTAPEGQRLSREEIRSKFAAIQKETESKVEHVIGSAHMEAYKKISEEFTDRFTGPRGGRASGP